MTDLTIIIPARNEEALIHQTLKNLQQKITISYNVIVVNDHSSDKTEEAVRQSELYRKKRLILLSNVKKIGFATALRTGLQKTKTRFVVFLMADNCDDPRTINRMYRKIKKEQCDIVCASRYMKGGKKYARLSLQHLFSRFVCKSLKLLTGIPTNDISNAFKLYDRRVFKRIRYINSAGVELSMIITLQAFFQGFKISEIPTTWYDRKRGNSKFKIIERFPRYLNIYWWALTNSIKKKIGFKTQLLYRPHKYP